MDRHTFSYRFGTAEFDEARFELRVAGLTADVERRALEVLLYLLRHAGEVVTKEELMREVWAGRITVDKVLPNAINKLRRALGEANASHISTHARIGYRLDGVVMRTAVGRQLASDLELAIGQMVPGRANFELKRQLGHTLGSEVWLAEHQKTHEKRVYKFALDGDSLRALKREATLMRLLQDSLSDHRHFVAIIDWNFELAPYFLECEYGGESLTVWAEDHLAALPTAARLSLFGQIVDAVADAHAVGVLHKDLKPANVLVTGGAGAPQVRLTDFGSGHLLEPDRLTQLGITRLGMTVEHREGQDSPSGTPLYIAPELFVGQVATVKSDVYALGILLYQLLSGRLGQPMASGWEAEIEDELLREDLRLATDGNPERRMASAAELADRLRQLDQRRALLLADRRLEAETRRTREALNRARTRRPLVAALFILLTFGVVVAVFFQRQAAKARDQAELELERATALTRFLNEDLIGRSNPLVSAKGPDATLREVLLAARERVPARFAAQPQSEAVVRANLASLFNSLDLFQDSEAEARRALVIFEQQGGAASLRALEARSVLARVLARQGRLEEAEKLLADLEALAASSLTTTANHHLALARSTLLIGRGEYLNASRELRRALDSLDAADPGNTPIRDSLRLDLIAVLAIAGEAEQAKAQGKALITEARERGEDSALLVALTQLALVRAQGEDHAAAERLLLEARPVIVEKLGENHTRHLQLLGELLNTAFRRGDWPRALEYAESAYQRIRRKLGDQHVLTHVSLTNWARTLNETGLASAAYTKARAAFEQLRELAGAGAPLTQDAAFVLAQSALELGRVQEAEGIIATLDAAVLKSYRATFDWQAGINALRGISAELRGDPNTALPLLAGALAALESERELTAPARLYRLAAEARGRLDRAAGRPMLAYRAGKAPRP